MALPWLLAMLGGDDGCTACNRRHPDARQGYCTAMSSCAGVSWHATPFPRHQRAPCRGPCASHPQWLSQPWRPQSSTLHAAWLTSGAVATALEPRSTSRQACRCIATQKWRSLTMQQAGLPHGLSRGVVTVPDRQSLGSAHQQSRGSGRCASHRTPGTLGSGAAPTTCSPACCAPAAEFRVRSV